jgi:hypothetical protein
MNYLKEKTQMKKLITICVVLVFAITCRTVSADITYLQDFSNPDDPLIRTAYATVHDGICSLQSQGDTSNAVVGIATDNFGITFDNLLNGSVEVQETGNAQGTETLPYFYFCMDTNHNGYKDTGVNGDDLIIQTDSSLTGPNADGWYTLSFNRNTIAGISTSANGYSTNNPPYQSLSIWMSTYPDTLWRVYVGLGSLSSSDYSTCNLDNLQFTYTPEPATIALLGLGALGLIRRKR